MASTARRTLSAQLDKVEAGGQVEISRRGRVVAVLVSPDRLSQLRAVHAWEGAERIAGRLERARREPLGAPALTVEQAEDLIATVSAQRSR